MKSIFVYFVFVAAIWPSVMSGQGFISYDYAPESTMRSKTGDRFGRGSMQKVEGRCNFTLAARQDSLGRATVWSLGVGAAYASLDNHGLAATLNPDDIFNGGLSLLHARPFSRRWDIMLSLGCGIYSPTRELSHKSLLVNGALLFIYRINRNMRIGVGGGLTNSYGVPMLLPMMYFSWETHGRYELKVDMTNSVRVTAATRLNRWFRMELVAIEMEGMAAVMEIDGKSQIYSTMTMCSYLKPTLRLDRRTSIFLGFGGNWLRGTEITTRNLKGLFSSFKDDDDSKYFNVSLRLMAGIQYGF